jgi:Uma2 family endonuclease
VMAPAGLESGGNSGENYRQLANWSMIDPERRTVWVYSQSQPQGREITNLDSISSESLAGFTLDLRPIWQALDV